MWHEGTPRCGTYSEIQPAPPGAPGSIPNVELADLQGVLQDAAAAAAAGASLAVRAAAAGTLAADQVSEKEECGREGAGKVQHEEILTP